MTNQVFVTALTSLRSLLLLLAFFVILPSLASQAGNLFSLLQLNRIYIQYPKRAMNEVVNYYTVCNYFIQITGGSRFCELAASVSFWLTESKLHRIKVN